MKVLGGKKSQQPKVYIGAARWGAPVWVGKLYPPGTKEKDFLSYYVQHFNCIELNATHYKVYDTATIGKWAAKAGDKDFLFFPKLFKGLTHQGSMLDKEPVVAEFINGITAFHEHLGPTFIQLSETFSPARKEELFTFLKSLPSTINFFVEVRHPEWFSNEQIRREYFNTLYSLNMGAVITDTASRRDCAHMYLTVPKVFIRYVGNNLHPTDYTRIDAWTERITYWLENGLQEVYFIMHMHEELCAPEMTVYLSDKLFDATGIRVEKPKFIQPGSMPGGAQISFFE